MKIIHTHKAKEKGLGSLVLCPEQISLSLLNNVQKVAGLFMTLSLLFSLIHHTCYPHFAPHPFAFSALCSWKHPYELIPQATLPSSFLLSSVSRRRLRGARQSSGCCFPSSCPIRTSGSAGSCIRGTKGLSRTATSLWFQLSPPKGLRVEMAPSFQSYYSLDASGSPIDFLNPEHIYTCKSSLHYTVFGIWSHGSWTSCQNSDW